MKDYYICIDVGGTDIKCGIVDKEYNILYKTIAKTAPIGKTKTIIQVFEELFEDINKNSGFDIKNSKGVGIGFPGLVDQKNTQVKYMPNIKLESYDFMEDLQKLCPVPVKIANDAELALLAEQKLGAGKGYNNFILLTLGTGLGCGVVIDGKPLRNSSSFSCECGHVKDISTGIEYGAMTSTRALINQTKKAMQDNPNSKMWTKYNLSTVNGKTVFEFFKTDKTAKQVLDAYIKNLGMVISNLCTLLSPELVIIGGGASAQGKTLTNPLENFVNKTIFTKNIDERIKITSAKFSNDAGILGARCLFN